MSCVSYHLYVSTKLREAICSMFNEQTSIVVMMQIDSPATNWFRAWKIAISRVREGDAETNFFTRTYNLVKRSLEDGNRRSPRDANRITCRIMGRCKHDGNHFPGSINNYDRSDIYGNSVGDSDTRRSLPLSRLRSSRR